MRLKTVIVGAVTLLMINSLPLLSQTDDDLAPSPFSFQGRVGALFTGDEPFKNGAAFEIGMMIRLLPRIHLNVSGGTGNFKGGTELMPISEEFAVFWEQVLLENRIYDAEEATYRINFGTVGAAFKFGHGRFDPYGIAGVGIYQVRFTYSFSFHPLLIPDEITDFDGVTSIQDDKYVFGWHVGGGFNYSINQIIGFGGQVSFHSLDTEAIDNQIMATFGLNVTIP